LTRATSSGNEPVKHGTISNQAMATFEAVSSKRLAAHRLPFTAHRCAT
jgi:hypothetical protein